MTDDDTAGQALRRFEEYQEQLDALLALDPAQERQHVAAGIYVDADGQVRTRCRLLRSI